MNYDQLEKDFANAIAEFITEVTGINCIFNRFETNLLGHGFEFIFSARIYSIHVSKEDLENLEYFIKVAKRNVINSLRHNAPEIVLPEYRSIKDFEIKDKDNAFKFAVWLHQNAMYDSEYENWHCKQWHGVPLDIVYREYLNSIRETLKMPI